MPAMKTPGVYIVEKNAFPNSIVEVATAVPAFIGYTEMAVNGGESLKGRPWRISSMAEYIRYFGGPAAARFSVGLPAAAGGAAPEPPKPTDARSQVSKFTWNKRVYTVTRAAGKAGGRFLMYLSMRHFFLNGGGPCFVVSVGGYDAEIDAGNESKDLIGGLAPLIKEQEPTMVLIPDAVLLTEPDCIMVQQQMLQHCGLTMRSRVAVLDIWGGDRDRRDPEFNWSCIDNFRSDLGINQLDFAAAYYPWLNTSLVAGSDMDYSQLGDAASIGALVDLLKADLGITPDAIAADADGKRKLQQRSEALDAMAITDDKWAEKLTAEVVTNRMLTQGDRTAATSDITAQMGDPATAVALLAPLKQQVHKSVLGVSELYGAILEAARRQMNLIPPAAAMAGLYTMVDNTRGVWKAPANVSIAGVVSPAVDISAADQEDLNVTTQGKSINAIRSFIGEGALVWGARTLDGNSLDWRYINVRRTMIMLEESCRLAAKAMVFEPNVANTWVTIKSMISNFLTGIWKRGGLMGAVPDDAFSVHCGLGETMTPEDVLEGILRVTVLVAMVRPAEFIEITFQQLMPKS